MSSLTQQQLAAAAMNILGPALIGICLDLVLYGVSLAQVYFYYCSSIKDRIGIQFYVMLLVAVDTLATSFDVAFLFIGLIKHYGSELTVTQADWLFMTNRALTAVIGFQVQLFYAYRVWMLTKNKIITVVIVLLAIASCGGGVAVGIQMSHFSKYLEFDGFRTAGIIWLTTGTVNDIFITAILVYYLRSHKTGFERTDDIVDRIISLSVQTGALTSVSAILDLILFVGFSNKNAVHLFFNTLLAKLYVNSLLSSLNTRRGRAFNSSQNDNSKTHNAEHISLSGTRPAVVVNVESTQFRHDDSTYKVPMDEASSYGK